MRAGRSLPVSRGKLGTFTSLRIKRPHSGPGPTMARDSGQAVCTLLLLCISSSAISYIYTYRPTSSHDSYIPYRTMRHVIRQCKRDRIWSRESEALLCSWRHISFCAVRNVLETVRRDRVQPGKTEVQHARLVNWLTEAKGRTWIEQRKCILS